MSHANKSHHRQPGNLIMGANSLAGYIVRNNQSEYLGMIKEIMIDMQTGTIAYAVLSHGGFLMFGHKLFAVPWSSLKPDGRKHSFTLDVDKRRLLDAKGFDVDNWPPVADQRWIDATHRSWQTSHE